MSLLNGSSPLMDFARSLYPFISLRNSCVIAVQHLLGTVHTMFRSWLELGLQAENIYVLGKCYSSNAKVMEEMRALGIYVSPHSFAFHSHIAYDDLFDELIESFLESHFQTLRHFERVIVLDDGGHLIHAVRKKWGHQALPIVAVEQTTSGYEKLKHISLNFPVVNVAKSIIKLKYEPPWVARIVVEQTWSKLVTQPESIFIMGRGAIGSAIHSLLAKNFPLLFWDINGLHPLSLDDLLPKVDLIFGCTGNVSLPHSKHPLLKKGCVLASGSSSDREFDSVYLRRHFPASFDCHSDFNNGHFHLLNSGFPVNFTGSEHCVSPEQIQLIRALITMGVLQAVTLEKETRGFIDLNEAHQATLIAAFKYHTEKNPKRHSER